LQIILKPKHQNCHERRNVMALTVKRVDTWAAPLEDTPGSLAGKLKALADAGVNLEFVIARRAPDTPGTGVVFATPITGASRVRAAKQAGFEKTTSLHAVRVEGPDKPGRGRSIAEALSEEGLNLRGFSAAAINNRFVAHVAFDAEADAALAARILRRL
jgi:hypothetical protein